MDEKFLSELKSQVEKRRTFAIISHPDAGKTTLTEKLLLFGGAIIMAGAVKSRKTSRRAFSDWMAIEQERGISVTSSVMKFEYKGLEINLLDTPGHRDFSEDTYRVLTAVDSAVMVIDSVKGVEEQTKRLMEVCRMRDTPVITFVNKLDREGMEPLEILSNIEENLGIQCAPLTWPIGMGKAYKGTYDLYRKSLTLFRPGFESLRDQDVIKVIKDLSDPDLDRIIGLQAKDLRQDAELLEGASDPFQEEKYLKGQQSPVFFGSAVNNFGIREMLDAFVEIAPSPRPRETKSRIVSPLEPHFSGFVFKIQANMDPSHRDRLAFMRVCSGKFQKAMKAKAVRTGKEVLFSNPTIFMAQNREAVDEAWPGDIVGIQGHGGIQIGDTFTDREDLQYTGIPSFAPEHFRRVRLDSPMKSKQLKKGLLQLSEEGAIQVFRPLFDNSFILGAVGVLQFDVAVARLKDEYAVEASYDPTSYNTARWVRSKDPKKLKDFEAHYRLNLAKDRFDRLVYLAQNAWDLQYTENHWPDIEFLKTCEQE